MSYTWHLHGIHKALTCNTHVMPMAYTWPRVHMALTWNAHKTHVEYPWNALCIHREYTWHVIHMVCTWDTTTMIHIAYLCTWHTHTHCMHGMHMVCTSCVHSVRLHYTWHHMAMAMAYIACYACLHHMHCMSSIPKIFQRIQKTPHCWSFLPLRPCQCRAHRRWQQLQS